MNLRLRQKMILSWNVQKKWTEAAPKTKNHIVLEKICRIALTLRPRRKMKFSQNIFYNWNELSAKTEKVIVLECLIKLD